MYRSSLPSLTSSSICHNFLSPSLMATSLKVHKVLSIAPPSETFPTTFPFTFFDSLWLRIPPVERLFFYEVPNVSTTSFFDSILPNLKHSLELTLQHFLLLVGNIKWPQDSSHPIINMCLVIPFP